MIQNDRICRVGNLGYFCDRNTGSIYSYNFENAMIRLEDIEKSELQWYRKYRFCLNKNNKLYCIPDRSKRMKVYDLENKNSTYISLGNELRYFILDAWIIGDTLWFVSIGTNQIFEINLKLDKVLSYKIFDDETILCGYKCDLYKNTIYIVALNSKKIVEFNLEKKEKKIIELDVDESGFSIVICKDGNLFLTGLSYILYRLNCENYIVEKKGEFIKEKNEERQSEKQLVFTYAEHIDGDIIFIPSGYDNHKNCIFYVKCEKNLEIKKYDFNDVINVAEIFTPEYVRNRCIGLYGEITSAMYEFNVDTKEIGIMQNHCEIDSMKKLFENSKAIIEGFAGIALNDYIKIISEKV